MWSGREEEGTEHERKEEGRNEMVKEAEGGKRQLTNLLELLFLTVFALPKDSRRGLDSRITSFTLCMR